MYSNLSRDELIHILHEKDCYITALEQQLQSYRCQSLEDENYINESQENAICQSKVKQYQIQFQSKKPLTNSNQSSRQSNKVKQKIIHESIDTFLDEISIEVNDPKLFEEFHVFGLGDTGFKSIYKFTSRFGGQYRPIKQLIKFVIPFEQVTRNITFNDNYSDIYSIIYQNFNIQQNGYVVSIKIQDTEQYMYYVCMKYKDFSCFDKTGKSIKEHTRIICLQTQLPFFSFYFNFLITVLNDIKYQRIEELKRTKLPHAVDSQYADIYMQQNIHLILNQLTSQIHPFEFKLRILNTSLNLNLYDQQFDIEWVIYILYQGICFIVKKANNQITHLDFNNNVS